MKPRPGSHRGVLLLGSVSGKVAIDKSEVALPKIKAFRDWIVAGAAKKQ